MLVKSKKLPQRQWFHYSLSNIIWWFLLCCSPPVYGCSDFSYSQTPDCCVLDQPYFFFYKVKSAGHPTLSYVFYYSLLKHQVKFLLTYREDSELEKSRTITSRLGVINQANGNQKKKKSMSECWALNYIIVSASVQLITCFAHMCSTTSDKWSNLTVRCVIMTITSFLVWCCIPFLAINWYFHTLL